jgi:hypothetical protein
VVPRIFVKFSYCTSWNLFFTLIQRI